MKGRKVGWIASTSASIGSFKSKHQLREVLHVLAIKSLHCELETEHGYVDDVSVLGGSLSREDEERPLKPCGVHWERRHVEQVRPLGYHVHLYVVDFADEQDELLEG